jgi:virginiamycin B lyase
MRTLAGLIIGFISIASALQIRAEAETKEAKQAKDSNQGKPARTAAPVKGPRDLKVIRPGAEGAYGMYTASPVMPSSRVIGELAGRQILEIDTPVKISGMGKYMAQDTKGNIWYVETREDTALKIDPKTLAITRYMLPKGAAPYSIAIDSKDVVWVTAHGIEMLLEVHPDKGYTYAHQPPSHGFLIHINVDRRTDMVWFTQPGNNQIVSYRADVGFKEYPSPTKQSGPGRLDFDADGNVWFPELYVDKLAKLEIATGKITEWKMPSTGGLPAGVRVDHHTGIVWVSEPMVDALAAFKDGKFREYKIPTVGSVVSTNVTDEQGYVWFTEGGWRGSAGGNKIGRLDPKSGKVDEFDIPYENAQPLGMIRGSDDSIWFSLVTGAKVCRVLPRDVKARGR